jgi:hypothetical protein
VKDASLLDALVEGVLQGDQVGDPHVALVHVQHALLDEGRRRCG